MSREGRVIRWLATTLVPEVYDRLVGEEKKKWAEGSAQSYFLARIEARVMDSFAAHCVEICKPGSGRVLEHLSLQFDGA